MINEKTDKNLKYRQNLLITLKKVFQKVKPYDSIKIEISKIEDYPDVNYKKVNGYEILINNKGYRVLTGNIPYTEYKYTIYDKSGRLHYGTHKIVLRKLDNNIEKIDKFDQWSKNAEGSIVKLIDAYNSEKILKILKSKNIPFKFLIDFLLDDTGQKDQRIIDLYKTAMLPIPMYLRTQLQPFNPHALVFTNSGVAKTTTGARILGYEPGSDYSAPGLIGALIDGKKVSYGSLNGTGFQILDETSDTITSDNSILTKILNYCESGETRRELATPIICLGTKQILVFSNIYGNIEETIKSKIVKLAGSDSLERIGRRYPIALLGIDFNKVTPDKTNVILIEKIRIIIESIINQNADKISKALLYSFNWYKKEDIQYKREILTLSTYSKSNSLKEYMKGLAGSSYRLKFAALKIAILENLDILSECENKEEYKQFFKIIIPQAKNNYIKLKEYNLKSFLFLQESKKQAAIKMIKEDKNWQEVEEKTNIKRSTYFKYKKEVLKNEM